MYVRKKFNRVYPFYNIRCNIYYKLKENGSYYKAGIIFLYMNDKKVNW